ncbi:dephospho-CoA kinase [bacterium]|nr:dephospho-CoA kinase [bacterium]
MLKIGLTGNIASGKSEVEKAFMTLGYEVCDLDEVCHNFLENNEEIKNQVLAKFNTLNRAEISSIVFLNPQKRKILEQIMFPKLKEYILKLFEKPYNTIIISGALLYEANFASLFDRMIWIDAPYDVRLKRLMKRNGYTVEQAKIRLDAQSQNHKAKADYIIQNTGSIYELCQKVARIVNSFG